MRQRGNVIQRLITHTRKFIVFFLETNTAHGLQYLVLYGLHAVERIVWICCIAIGIFGMISLAQRILYRYQTSPMVVSMDRNMYFWNTSFPSLTLCPHIRIDSVKVDQYIQLHSEKFATNEDAVDFREFIVKLANVTYETFLELPMNRTYGILSEDYLDLIMNLSLPLQFAVSSGTTVPVKLQPTVTETGICVAVNSRMAIYSSREYWKNQRWDLVPLPTLSVIHPLDGEVLSQLNELKSSYDVYFHGYMEVPEISKKRYSFYEAFFTTVELSAQEIFTSSNAKE
ncbi:uncharacterized protein LOC129773968 [Toxorhynchites rutilus septentrionalis]|uniref:uncharacterized protein LOC129773968 n=1 Tax=Toxorhynchites rutilus septentrionalis TaxID=329112 RepID=UPI002478B403|nr:uncharacterized protein LOC129773968 [Toxorhynchites rutilus septentrionalis]